NAMDAMPNGGELKIATANVFIDENYSANHVGSYTGHLVLLCGADTGSGISEEQQEYIFDPFYTTKGTAKGAGLGLAMVYGIVKQSGGHIWADSKIGQGSTFKIYLPRMDEPADIKKPAASVVRAGSGGETLLLVE